MTDKTILDRYATRGTGGDGATELESADDLGAFGYLRGIRDAARMLELRRKDGNILAVGYGWLERLEFNPSEGLTLYVVGRTIRIKGRNLNVDVRPGVRLFESIVRHRVPWLREADEPESLEAGEKATVIERIEW